MNTEWIKTCLDNINHYTNMLLVPSELPEVKIKIIKMYVKLWTDHLNIALSK